MAKFPPLRALFGRARETAPVPVARAANDRDAAVVELAAAEAALATAETEYRAGLLSADEDGLRVLAQTQADAGVRRDRARALIDAFHRQIADAEAREDAAVREAAEAEHMAQYDAARIQADEARTALSELYPQLAADIVSLLRVVADAELVVKAANADLPPGAAPLDPIQASIRDLPGTPAKVIEEVEVERWCRPGEQYPGALNQKAVQTDRRGDGYLSLSSLPAQYLVRRKFIERRTAKAIPYEFHYPLAQQISLPGLRAKDPAVWRSLEGSDPARVLAQIEALAGIERRPATPEIEVKLTPVDPFDREAELRPAEMKRSGVR